MLGETSGIKMFMFDGKDGWTISDDYNELQIPDVLRNIKLK